MSLPPPIDIPQQLSLATRAWAKLRRLAMYAAFDGWTLSVLGALTLVCGGYGSVLGLLMSFVLLGAGIFEIYSVRQLRQLKPSAINHLAYNQMALAGMLVTYSIISMIQSRHGGGLSAEIQQSLADAGGAVGDTNDQLSAATDIFYCGLMAFALLVQGGTAMYYFSRRKHLQRYLEETPDWIQQMQRERGEISL
jgi:hypothetical protein